MIGYLSGSMISVKKSRELMNSIMTSDEASKESEFFKCLILFRVLFTNEQIECIHRIACHGRDVLAVLPTGLAKSVIYVNHRFR